MAWQLGGSGGTSCVTNALGTCTVTRTGISRALFAARTATVTNVTTVGNTLDYVAVDNHDPDSGAQASNGTAITVPRP